MSEDTYRHDYGAWLFGGHAEIGYSRGVDGDGNAQQTSSQVDLQNFLVEFRICTDLLQGGYYDGHSSQNLKLIASDLI
jgi:hypothetical protein